MVMEHLSGPSIVEQPQDPLAVVIRPEAPSADSDH